MASPTQGRENTEEESERKQGVEIVLAYFPTIYPNELLYSALARYQRHAGLSTRSAIENLFGITVPKGLNVETPTYIQALVSRLPKAMGITAADLINHHTLFPYYKAMARAEDAAKAHDAILNGTTEATAFSTLGRTVVKNRSLLFCPECVGRMMQEGKDAYWRREHQLPGAFVCVEHRCPLRISEVNRSIATTRFIAATKENCPIDAMPILGLAQVGKIEFFLAMADEAARLLRTGRFTEEDHRKWWSSFYEECEVRSLTTVKGMSLPNGNPPCRGNLKMKSLKTQLGAVLDFVEPVLPNLFLPNGRSGPWVNRLCSWDRVRRIHPIWRHVALEGVRLMPKKNGGFPIGPWPCCNPLAIHKGQNVVTEIYQRGHTDARVGHFTCRCGYTYTRSINRKGIMSEPRVKRWGPLLLRFTEWAFEQGMTKKAASRCSGIHSVRLVDASERLMLGDWPYRSNVQRTIKDFHKRPGGAKFERSLFHGR